MHRRKLNNSPMSVFNTLMIIAVLGSVLFCSLVIHRTIQYNKKYHLPESSYTRLFGFITKEYIAAAYAAFVLFTTIFSIWFILTLWIHKSTKTDSSKASRRGRSLCVFSGITGLNCLKIWFIFRSVLHWECLRYWKLKKSNWL